MTTSLTSSDDEFNDTEPVEATGLLVCRDAGFGGPDDQAVERLCTILDARGLRRGHRVGTVIAVTGPTQQLQALADHVEAARLGAHPTGADDALLDALSSCIEAFAWDEGAETF